MDQIQELIPTPDAVPQPSARLSVATVAPQVPLSTIPDARDALPLRHLITQTPVPQTTTHHGVLDRDRAADHLSVDHAVRWVAAVQQAVAEVDQAVINADSSNFITKELIFSLYYSYYTGFPARFLLHT